MTHTAKVPMNCRTMETWMSLIRRTARRYTWASRYPATTPPPAESRSIGNTFQPTKLPVTTAPTATR